jgi:hypothetical protein
MKTIYNSGFETALTQGDVAKLEKILDTRFINIKSFFQLNDLQRVFKRLLDEHSIIKVNHTDGSWTDYENYPLSMYPPLHMFVTEDVPNKTFVEYKFNGKAHKTPLIDYPDLSEMLDNINDVLTDGEFMFLDGSYRNENGTLISNWTWFMVPTTLNVNELCRLVGYSNSKPLEVKPPEDNGE